MKFFTPNTKDELFKFLAEKKYTDKIQILAGGTSLIEHLNKTKDYPNFIVDIKNIEDYKEIYYKYDEQTLIIGSTVTLTEITENDFINSDFEILAEAAFTTSSRPIRNRATIGGNLLNLNGDIAPILLVTDSLVNIKNSENQTKILPLTEFYLKRHYLKKKDEIIESISIPDKYFNRPSKIIKIKNNFGNNSSTVNLAMIIIEGNKIRFAGSSCAEVPLFLGEYNLTLTNNEIIAQIMKKVNFSDDEESTAQVRKDKFTKAIFELIEFGRNPEEEIMINIIVDEAMHTFHTTDRKTLFELLKEESYTNTPYVILNGRVIDSRYIFATEVKNAEVDTIDYHLRFEDSRTTKLLKYLEKYKVTDNENYQKEIIMLFYETMRENTTLTDDDILNIVKIADFKEKINKDNLIKAIKEYQSE